MACASSCQFCLEMWPRWGCHPVVNSKWNWEPDGTHPVVIMTNRKISLFVVDSLPNTKSTTLINNTTY